MVMLCLLADLQCHGNGVVRLLIGWRGVRGGAVGGVYGIWPESEEVIGMNSQTLGC